GTGNYHPKTARLYEDMGLLTCSAEVGEDVGNLFNVLSGYSMNTDYARLLVAPHSVRTGLIERIEREIDNHQSGMTSGIRFKCNALVDEPVIDALYRASQAGVPVDVWVRGICALRPGVPGLSETIRVVSILGRFLEHSRAYCFENGGNREVWIGSADMMHRNLDRRVETLVSLIEPTQVSWVNELFDMAMGGDFCVWNLSVEGVWTRKVYTDSGELMPDYQETLMARTRHSGVS
ncbi:MAG: RNA degradosome polyphosphate kinase, partial [Actinomycetota bacterium]|nr:RNA degradosome polyphosphate kinase [Actinomycetota bacterium]